MPLNDLQRQLILDNPIGDTLDALREALTTESEALSEASAIDIVFDLGRTAAANKLCAGEEQQLITKQLRSLLRRLQQGDVRPYHFRPLAKYIKGEASDVTIWEEVIRLSKTPVNSTPPRSNQSLRPSSVPPTSETTPSKSSASRLPSTETSKTVQDELFGELQFCTFRAVEGFFERFFNPDSWDLQQKTMFATLLKEHDGTKWVDFPVGDTSEANVKKWIFDLYRDCLADANNKVRTTVRVNQLDIPNSQVDLFFLHRNAKEIPFRYKDIYVVGELKSTYKSNNFKSDFFQLARYVRNMFDGQPLRLYAHAFLLLEDTMELWVFDRSGAYSSGTFNIHNDREKFARALVAYSTMELEGMGFLPHLHTPQTLLPMLGDAPLQVELYDPDSSVVKIFTLHDREIFKSRALVSRGTTCFATVDGHVAKFSWVPNGRVAEVSHYKQASDRGVEGIPRVLAHRVYTSTSQIRSGLIFPKAHQFLSSGEEVPIPPEGWQDRVFRCHVVTPWGRTIDNFSSARELLETMRDAIRAHQSLLNAGILHRDISSNNIIITEPADVQDFKGMLIDLDVAKVLGDEKCGAYHITGTLPFMSISVLRGESHSFRDDLESFLYVLIWMCARRAWTNGLNGEERPPKSNPLRRWEIGSPQDIARLKTGDMSAKGLKYILDVFPRSLEMVKRLCETLRSILFGNTFDVYDEDSENHDRLYAMIILAFEQTLDLIPIALPA